MSDKCPKCGAGLDGGGEYVGIPLFACGYRTDAGGYGPGGRAECLRRQLAAVTAERDKLVSLVEQQAKEVERLQAIVVAAKAVAAARSDLLCAYRTNNHEKAGRALDRLTKAECDLAAAEFAKKGDEG